jgi:hypothetical protein
VEDTTAGIMDEDVTKDPAPIRVKEVTDDEKSMVKMLEYIIHLFLDLLQVTGGDWAPKKYVWYLIAHRWNKGMPTLLANTASHSVILMTSKATGRRSTVKRKAVTQGHSTFASIV